MVCLRNISVDTLHKGDSVDDDDDDDDDNDGDDDDGNNNNNNNNNNNPVTLPSLAEIYRQFEDILPASSNLKGQEIMIYLLGFQPKYLCNGDLSLHSLSYPGSLYCCIICKPVKLFI
jgi:hypothetical protein